MEACCDERGAAPEDPDDHKRRMLRLAEEALQRAEDEQAKEVGYVVVNSSEDTDPLPENPGDSGGRVAKMLRQRTFFVNHGVSIEDNLSRRGFRSYNIHTVDDWRGRVQKATGANFVSVPTADGRTLDAFYVQARGGGIDNKACAILFHANAMISLDMALWAKWYSVRGIAALAITMGGYAESSYIPTSELTTYFDAQAAVEFALAESGLTIDRLLVHGLSIGGALASAAAAANPGLNCTVDQTFVNAHEVAVTCGKEFSSRVPTWLIKASVSSMFREGVADPRLPGYVTDQYNNEAKAATIRGNYFVFWACDDHMMLPEYAIRLYQAWSDKFDDPENLEDGFDVVHEGALMKEVNKRVATINGAHCAFFGHDAGASRKYETYLTEIWGVRLPTDVRRVGSRVAR